MPLESGWGCLGTTNIVGNAQICIIRLSEPKCRERFLGGGVRGSRISQKPLEEQEMVVAWTWDQGTCRVRETGGFKIYLGGNISSTALLNFSFYLVT